MNILVVEDDVRFYEGLENFLESDDQIRLEHAISVRNAIEKMELQHYNVIVLDHFLDRSAENNPEVNGPGVVEWLRRDNNEIPIIVYTSYSIENVKSAYPPGRVTAFLEKTGGPSGLVNQLKSVMDKVKVADIKVFEEKTGVKANLSETLIIGESLGMLELKSNIIRAASFSKEVVLILGENGTGKELVARRIHEKTFPTLAMPKKPKGLQNNTTEKGMLDVNCASLPRELLCRELFGHMKGSFTDAYKDMPGKFELANDSSIFLDEIGELPLDSQAAILRVIQERVITRIGGQKNIHVNCRMIFATNNDLSARVKNGTYREDLFYRLYRIVLKVPALRDRVEDIPLLASHFLSLLQENYGLAYAIEIADSAMEALMEHKWPGNVRELDAFLARAVCFRQNDEVISADDVRKHLII